MNLELLATAAASTDYESAPLAVRDRTVDLVSDTIAATAWGSRRSELQRLSERMARATPPGMSTVVGTTETWPSSSAAFVNGCAVAADQFQDGHREARGHPASHVVAPTLALAEEYDLSGIDALSAILAGYEVGVRIGRAMGGTPPGVHDIGTWGQIAVSAAVARLLAPHDTSAMQRAIELSAAAVLLTDAATVFAGCTGSHFLLGSSIAQGMNAALAAISGLKPLPGSLSRHLGTIGSRSWAENAADADDSSDGWRRFEILDGYLKMYPTCAHLHGVNDAIRRLLDDGLEVSEIRDIEARVFQGAAEFDQIAESELGARFSIPTSVAVALVTGKLDEQTLTSENVTTPKVVEMARRVRVVHDPLLDNEYPRGRPAAVKITLTDGTTAAARTLRPPWDMDHPSDRPAFAHKARRLLQGRFGTRGNHVWQATQDLRLGGPVRELGAALRIAAQYSTQP